MSNFEVITPAGSIQIEASCDEAAQLHVEAEGQGPVIEVKKIGDGHE